MRVFVCLNEFSELIKLPLKYKRTIYELNYNTSFSLSICIRSKNIKNITINRFLYQQERVSNPLHVITHWRCGLVNKYRNNFSHPHSFELSKISSQ